MQRNSSIYRKENKFTTVFSKFISAITNTSTRRGIIIRCLNCLEGYYQFKITPKIDERKQTSSHWRVWLQVLKMVLKQRQQGTRGKIILQFSCGEEKSNLPVLP